ncbi:hypothetical protein Fot_24252 [Forsythia ovata]|uniref:Uncharacterized protein n=1 Tax=Forsythia ovata TaxID=205694 RepID=A0ABD1U5Q4_9LAMI
MLRHASRLNLSQYSHSKLQWADFHVRYPYWSRSPSPRDCHYHLQQCGLKVLIVHSHCLGPVLVVHSHCPDYLILASTLRVLIGERTNLSSLHSTTLCKLHQLILPNLHQLIHALHFVAHKRLDFLDQLEKPLRG